MIKELKLVSNHSCWWKKKKYVKDSAQILKKFKSKGWKLITVKNLKKDDTTISTKLYKIYRLEK
ncbi:MAG: hypothetical protein CMI81_03910 [Candidatus Pelagibacter sp.]|nr:hypothetical protein [Candidatus Pelagibacter sp.]|tara:strand:- start:4622 stop:4813 length:192 start_codon:yes stop_codon:yes gene_type:complete